MDKKVLSVLKAVVKLCSNKYKVVDKEEIIALLGKTEIDKQSLMLVLRLLASKEYIIIKYEDDNDVCLCATAKGCDYTEGTAVVASAETPTTKLQRRAYFYVFLFAMLGGLAGGILSAVIALIIK